MKPIQFEFTAYLDYTEWASVNRDIFDRINILIVDITGQTHLELLVTQKCKYY